MEKAPHIRWLKRKNSAYYRLLSKRWLQGGFELGQRPSHVKQKQSKKQEQSRIALYARGSLDMQWIKMGHPGQIWMAEARLWQGSTEIWEWGVTLMIWADLKLSKVIRWNMRKIWKKHGKGHHSWTHNERLQPLVTAEVHILTIHNTLLNKQQMSSADFIT